MIDNLIKSEKIKKDILSNTEYIDWLENILVKYDSITSDMDEICDRNIENVKKLEQLFMVINEYFDNNFISPIEEPFSLSYNIKYNNKGYCIGIVYGQGCFFFCNKISLDNNISYVDFVDIMNNKKQDNVDDYVKILRRLSNSIKYAYKKGISLNFIIDEINKNVKELRLKDKELKLKKN